ncbi:hypothetical protein HRR83_006565 [Exophiala dermatitidis]|uniref:Zn(2)-C6 fungal-type domain-containing protein n=1 Tax=Exophiala dermatitidis TaxID=5970 RepID=A0AAN6ES65_EXODE|nr:hypothetical protein HRR74_005725 [Exophiala dermatitidis]KAJ4515450.1 hypothetical protein HRR73_005282 [Exophiala dermatitidis]KAJ4536492.1 hypothetical protein HRR77_007409 [Exophiala dermatitidis]KAJ4540979.1 hypothetical protein HRR76_004361 [Exophiala dermatitidis]KAJ4554798.1 hypothetical protein HRR79_009373 [Exophiala dermatitidis]
MDKQWIQHVPDVPRAKRRSRVQSACQRCRRQKLKCDQERPCSLCLRAEVPCVSEFRQRKRKRISLDESKPLAGQTDQEPSQSDGPTCDSSVPCFGHADDFDSRSTLEGPSVSPSRHKTAVSVDLVSSTDPDGYKERISSAGLTQEIIDNFSPETVLESSTSALPGGVGRSQPSPGIARDEITVEELFGFELPSKRVTDYLLNVYMGAVHWFMMVFHEPTLRASYEAFMANRRSPKSRSNQAIFILLLLSLGAHYASEEDVRARFPSFNLDTFQRLSLKRVEDSLHTLYDSAEIESVQVCVLLGSYYMYHGRPNLAFVILGAGISCAQLMSLHKESSWRWLSEIAKEERRRTFWALFVFDRFASTIFGRPCGIPLNDIDVKIPENIGDTTVQHPRFRSTATMPDGTVEPVTTFSYSKYKFKLYQISSPIISDLYFHRSSDVSELAIKVSRINEELVSWFNSLPPELKLEDLFRNPAEPVTANTRPFMLQALALQIAYDNVQILLHRPLLSQDLRKFKTSEKPARSHHDPEYPTAIDTNTTSAATDTDANTKLDSDTPDVHQILMSSRDACWDSAIRSSKLGRYQQCLATARESHACAFLGINLFTAGMVLCVVALARPLSAQAQMAKQAVARIMALSRFLSGKALLSAQTTKILKDLVHLIGEKEIKAMLSGSGAAASGPGPGLAAASVENNHSTNALTTNEDVDGIGTMPAGDDGHMMASQQRNLHLDRTPDHPQPLMSSEDGRERRSTHLSGSRNSNSNSTTMPPPPSRTTTSGIYEQRSSGPTPDTTFFYPGQGQQQTLPLSSSAYPISSEYDDDSAGFDFTGFETMDFNNGIITLQQAMFPASAITSASAATTTPDPSSTATAGTRMHRLHHNQHNHHQYHSTTPTTPNIPSASAAPSSSTRAYGQIQTQAWNNTHTPSDRDNDGDGGYNAVDTDPGYIRHNHVNNDNITTIHNHNHSHHTGGDIVGAETHPDLDANTDGDGGTTIGILDSPDFSMMNTVGQTWLWENLCWFTE